MCCLDLTTGWTGAAVQDVFHDCSIIVSDGYRPTSWGLEFRDWKRCDFGCSGLRLYINQLNSARAFFSVGSLLNFKLLVRWNPVEKWAPAG